MLEMMIIALQAIAAPQFESLVTEIFLEQIYLLLLVGVAYKLEGMFKDAFAKEFSVKQSITNCENILSLIPDGIIILDPDAPQPRFSNSQFNSILSQENYKIDDFIKDDIFAKIPTGKNAAVVEKESSELWSIQRLVDGEQSS